MNKSTQLSGGHPSPRLSRRSPAGNSPSIADNPSQTGNPVKYLLQNNIKLNVGEGDRGEQEIALIERLITECSIF